MGTSRPRRLMSFMSQQGPRQKTTQHVCLDHTHAHAWTTCMRALGSRVLVPGSHMCSCLDHTCAHAWRLCVLAPGLHTCSHWHPQVTTVSMFQGTLWVSLIHGSGWGLRHFRAPSPYKIPGEGTLQAVDPLESPSFHKNPASRGCGHPRP